MSHRQTVELVRHVIRSTLPLLGAADCLPSGETGWIRCGYQHCRRFSFGELQAVWFLEAGEVKFYRSGRTLLKVVRLDPLNPPGRRAR